MIQRSFEFIELKMKGIFLHNSARALFEVYSFLFLWSLVTMHDLRQILVRVSDDRKLILCPSCYHLAPEDGNKTKKCVWNTIWRTLRFLTLYTDNSSSKKWALNLFADCQYTSKNQTSVQWCFNWIIKTN